MWMRIDLVSDTSTENRCSFTEIFDLTQRALGLIRSGAPLFQKRFTDTYRGLNAQNRAKPKDSEL
mgnify:CR=1 FL=1